VSLLKEIGAILGFVAFGGLAVLAFLTFQQARHLRRLRDWAGRAPERAAAEAQRAQGVGAGATAVGRPAPEREGPSRYERLRGEASVRYEDVDRRMPFDPRLLVAALAAVIIGVGIATSGFGLLGEDEPSTGDETTTPATASPGASGIEVAVLNGTAPGDGSVGVVGIAKKLSKDVRAAGYEVGEVETAGSFPESVVMFENGARSDAEQLATDLGNVLGETATEPLTPEIEDLSGGAPLALVIGQDDGGL